MSYARFKDNRSFILCLIALVGALGLAYGKGVDVSMLVPTILGLYITGRTTEKVSAHMNARMDSDADFEKVAAMTDGSEHKTQGG
jgi:hypothetical protein